jgi:hypothetical protein
MAKLMGGDAPPAATDAPMLARMARPGIAPDKSLDMSKLDPGVQAALRGIPQIALNRIESNAANLGAVVNGWVVSEGLGTYDPGDYLKRATVAALGWPANQETDAIYPYNEVDTTGQKLVSANKYTLTFPKDVRPSVNGFWSITIYEIDQGWWFVPNALNKFTVSERDKPRSGKGGSLTLYFRSETPGKKMESNWLPAPKGNFILMLRMYWPKDTTPSILNDTWKPPLVERQS